MSTLSTLTQVVRSMWPRIRPKLDRDERLLITQWEVMTYSDGWRLTGFCFRVRGEYESVVRESYRAARIEIDAREVTAMSRAALEDRVVSELRYLVNQLRPPGPPVGWRKFGRRAR